jgi:hypothetical protein
LFIPNFRKEEYFVSKYPPKARVYEPLMHLVCIQNCEPLKGLELMREMLSYLVEPLPEMWTMLFRAAVVTNQYRNNTFASELRQLLQTSSSLYSVEFDEVEMQLIEQCFSFYSLKNQAVKVQIDSESCKCSNCNSVLKLLPLAASIKIEIANKLKRIGNETDFLKFETWIRENGPFKYIVDGANVAYFNQNINDGVFSYAQIDSLVATLQGRNDGKVLVVLPHHYGDIRATTFPNRAKCKYFSL